MMAGYFLRRYTKLLDNTFAAYLNDYVFKIAAPIQLFKNLSESDFHSVWDGKIVLFCFVISVLSIFIMLGLSFLLREKSLRAEFTQAGYRGSQALLGSALMLNIYGDIGSLALGIIGAVPVYNVAAVAVLTLMAPDGKLNRKTLGRAVFGILKNPLILGIAAGLLWSVLNIPQPAMLRQCVSSLAATTVPMGLLALGASVDLKKAVNCWKPSVVCTLFKLVLFPLIFLPLAVWLGFRGEMLTMLLIVMASPTTVAAFSMARSLGHEGVLSASVVMLTTVCSAFTLTGWLYILRALALI